MNDFMNTVMDFVKGSPLWAGLCAAGFVVCLLASILLMPAAELMPAAANYPSAVAPMTPGMSPVRSDAAMKAYKDIAEGLADAKFGTKDLTKLTQEEYGEEKNAPGELRAYVLYAIGFSAAVVAAAIAVCAIGRFEAEEKTVIPVKK